MYQTLYFKPLTSFEVTEFLNKQHKKGWKFICCDNDYYFFEKIA